MRIRHVIRAVTAFAVLVLALAAPAIAGTNQYPNTVGGALGWLNSDATGRTINAHFTLDAAIGDHFGIGPVVDYFYTNPNDEDAADPLPQGDFTITAATPELPPEVEETGAGSTTVIMVGGEVVWYFFAHHNGPQVGVAASRALEDSNGWLITPFAGLELGTERAALRIRYSHPYQLSEDNDAIDLERNEVTAGGVFRF